MRRTIELVGQLDPTAVDLEACDRLVHAFRGWRSEPEDPAGP